MDKLSKHISSWELHPWWLQVASQWCSGGKPDTWLALQESAQHLEHQSHTCKRFNSLMEHAKSLEELQEVCRYLCRNKVWLQTNIQYLPNPSPQVSITCRNYVAFMLPHSVTEAVIGIGAAVRAGQALYARILHNGKQRNWCGTCFAPGCDGQWMLVTLWLMLAGSWEAACFARGLPCNIAALLVLVHVIKTTTATAKWGLWMLR